MAKEKTLELKFSDEKYGIFGSKEHFFHYYWGYILPGMHLAIKTTEQSSGKYTLILEDCGPIMNNVAREMFSLLTDSIKFQNQEKFGKKALEVPRWDILINFDSVLFEDEHSLRGSTKEYRKNKYLQSILNQKGFLQSFQNEMRELRSWVLERVIGPDAAKPDPTHGLSRVKIPPPEQHKFSGPLPIRVLKRMVTVFLDLNGPRPIRYLQRVLRKMISKTKGDHVTNSLLTYGNKNKRFIVGRHRRRRPRQYLLLCRSPEPEYYSETGQAQAKKYGASRRSLVDIERSYKYFRRKGHNLHLYEPGSDGVFKQIEKFYNSDAVIGIKGAELSNAFWMQPGSKIFIVTPNVMRSTPVYERFARFIGVRSFAIHANDGRNPSLYRLRREIDDQLAE